MSTEILGYFSETDFCLISADEFRSRVDGNTRFCSRNTFFSCFLYISDSFSTRYSWSSFLTFLSYRTGKYVLIVRFYITPTRLLYRPFVKSMLRTMYNHTYTRTIFSLQLQSIYFILLLFFNRSTGYNFYYIKSTYIFTRRPCHLNITYLKFLT